MSCVDDASSFDHVQVINKLDNDGRSAFHYACLNDDIRLLTALLADDRVDVTLCSPRGDSGLHMAALYAALEAVKALLADGRIGVDAQNKYGETPLHLCAGSGDRSAAKAARLLLEHGASLLVPDQWERGPMDVSRENAENQLVVTFQEYLAVHPELREAVEERTKLCLERAKPIETDSANKAAKNAVLGHLGGVKLKKTVTTEKTMFAPQKKRLPSDVAKATNGRTPLSKLVDFPGDVEEIRAHLDNAAKIDPAAPDAYGLTALHKFASWNKAPLLELLLPHLSNDDLAAKDPAGKTALHWAVEMASVATVKLLIRAGADADEPDGQGRSVNSILAELPPSPVIDRLKAALLV